MSAIVWKKWQQYPILKAWQLLLLSLGEDIEPFDNPPLTNEEINEEIQATLQDGYIQTRFKNSYEKLNHMTRENISDFTNQVELTGFAKDKPPIDVNSSDILIRYISRLEIFGRYILHGKFGGIRKELPDYEIFNDIYEIAIFRVAWRNSASYSYFMEAFENTSIKPKKFIKWAISQKWDIPPEMAAWDTHATPPKSETPIQPAATTLPEPVAPSEEEPKRVQDKAATFERNERFVAKMMELEKADPERKKGDIAKQIAKEHQAATGEELAPESVARICREFQRPLKNG
ncbi:MAG: hypothetical protein HQL56_19310 [Magnetococcales bacterium]|nr:hypothetical protein [Magnetococcales bacterium]